MKAILSVVNFFKIGLSLSVTTFSPLISVIKRQIPFWIFLCRISRYCLIYFFYDCQVVRVQRQVHEAEAGSRISGLQTQRQIISRRQDSRQWSMLTRVRQRIQAYVGYGIDMPWKRTLGQLARLRLTFVSWHLHFVITTVFLDASSHLHMSVCPSVSLTHS